MHSCIDVNSFQVTFLLLMNFFRPSCDICIEQPASSWLFKQANVLEVTERYSLKKYLTHQGLWGGPLMKATHFLSTLTTLTAIERKATKEARSKFMRRIRRINGKRRREGLPVKEYYKKFSDGKFQGTKHLAETSIYPRPLVRAIFDCWKAKQLKAPAQQWQL